MATQLAAAASGVLTLLTGPRRSARVLGVHRAAVIIGVPVAGGQRLVSVLTAGAAAVPNGVRLRALADLSRIEVGEEAAVGERCVVAGHVDVRIARSWNSSVPHLRPAAVRLRLLAEAADDAEIGVPAAAVAALRGTVSDPGRAGLADAVDGLIGLGRGSTPGGDDVLAGVLAGLHARDATTLLTRITARLGELTERTTALSADLLALAADGHSCLEALDVLRAVGGSGTGVRYAAAVRRLLSIGSTSGADLATGLAIGLSVGGPNGRSLGGTIYAPAGATDEPLTTRVRATLAPAFADDQGP